MYIEKKNVDDPFMLWKVVYNKVYFAMGLECGGGMLSHER